MWIRPIIVICFSLLMHFLAIAEQFKMGGDTIKARISYQNLNRISVKGDRIDSIVGIDSAFHFEKNEKTGDVFLRPTEVNGYNPISLSLTTVSGKTQDLLLEVTNGEARSIELIMESATSTVEFSGSEERDSDYSNYEESISEVMKKFINNSGRYKEISVTFEGRNHMFLTAEFESAYTIDGFLCLKYKIGTTRDGIFELDERMFSRSGDIALSLSSLSMRKGDSVTLYVLRR